MHLKASVHSICLIYSSTLLAVDLFASRSRQI